MSDSNAYLKKKKQFAHTLTLYGRKPVLEALQDNSLHIERLHLAESNQRGGILNEILSLAEKREIPQLYHDRQALSRISKNKKQDQGVALDIHMRTFNNYETALEQGGRYLALDRVTNPQNLGMIIRSVCASPLQGLLLPRKGGAKVDALVIKASAGTVFRCPIFWCDELATCLSAFAEKDSDILALDGRAKTDWQDFPYQANTVFVLGNETEGLSDAVRKTCKQSIRIPLQNNVESLNVAVTAGILAFGLKA